MLNVHTSGADAMLWQARQAIVDFGQKYPNKRLPLIVGVIILTSVSDSELKSTFKFNTMDEAVMKLALKASKTI